MSYKRLFVLIEGEYDERFFKSIIFQYFEEKYEDVIPYKYAQIGRKLINNFLNSIKEMGADYIYFEDIDLVPCITKKKEKIINKHNRIDEDKIIVVIKEIESWYLAGLDDSDCQKLKIKTFKDTDEITKEEFTKLKPKQFDSSKDFMIELLKYFSIDIAVQKNKSFSYFLQKYEL